MAEKPMSNFKTAVNELMNGKIKTDEPTASGAPIQTSSPPAGDDSSDFRSSASSFSPSGPVTSIITSAEGGTSILSSDLIIEGTVKSKSDIKLHGYIKGDVSCGGELNSTGTIDGSIDGINITLVGSTINGNINARGSVLLDNSSSVTGDIVANALTSDGKVKGNIMLKDTILLKANSSVIGNIKAKSISIETGTTIIGNMEIKAAAAPEPAPQPEPAPIPEPEPKPEPAPASDMKAETEAKPSSDSTSAATTSSASSTTPSSSAATSTASSPGSKPESASDAKTETGSKPASASDTKTETGTKPASASDTKTETETKSGTDSASAGAGSNAMADLLAKKEALRESLNKKND